MKNFRLWFAFVAVIVISFAVLGYFGMEIYHQAPPIPEKVVTESGKTLFTGQEIKDGQNVWQSIGGQEVGTVWGHGAYVAPDWSADWLHKEAVYISNVLARREYNADFNSLDAEKQAVIKIKLQKELRTNRYNKETKELVVSDIRAEAIAVNMAYYAKLFMNDPSMDQQRNYYAIRPNSVDDNDRMKRMNCFFFWAAWACVTNRENSDITYTHNWPPDKLVGNVATNSLLIWSVISVIILLLGIALLTFYYAKSEGADDEPIKYPAHNPLMSLTITPSMKATLKYFWVVTALILVQVILGIITAHYAVEGNGFYGIGLSTILPYSISRTWHVQLAVFWIATSWLATGLYIAPSLSGKDPKYQRIGVNFLFVSLLIIVVGSFIGEWLGIMQKLGLLSNFWFGHQGYEYVDLGRFWQIYLLIGLILWLFLMLRALLPSLREKTENRQLLTMFVISTIAITGFYGAGLMWGQQTHLSIAEYWRWWVVHLWVEGFFEVFAVVVAAFIFVRLGLVKIKTATIGVISTTIIYLTGGIIGTFHHLYFAGTPMPIIALGATFSALEVVPLVLVGYEAFHNYRLSKATTWIKSYKWPIYCLLAVSFWNLVGAGLFGFLLNPPIALYYIQGLNTTPVHGHTALFGVYGMLGIGLMLFVLKGLSPQGEWKDKPIKIAFWSINIGLALMVLLSMLPIGIAQALASIEHGIWYARSSEFMQNSTMITIKWFRVIGDTLFAIGTVYLAYFVIGLKTGWSIEKNTLQDK